MSRAAVPTRGGPYSIACPRYNARQQAGRSAARRVEIIITRRSQRHGMGGQVRQAQMRTAERSFSAMSMQDDVNRIAQVLRETAYSLGVPSIRELEASWRDLAKAAILTTLETVREHQPQAWSPPSTAVTLWRAMIDVMRAEIERALLDS